jgi:hypothetical protein
MYIGSTSHVHLGIWRREILRRGITPVLILVTTKKFSRDPYKCLRTLFFDILISRG